MKQQKVMAVLFFALFFLFILDAKAVFHGASQGISLCIYTVIPSLFPFFVISAMLTGALTGIRIPGLEFIGKICHIPSGAESVLLIGLLGGYPVGAKAISDCCQKKQLDIRVGRRMLGFCSNCGPSFIFGICGSLFTNPLACWALWAIQIISAIITGLVLPVGNINSPTQVKGSPVTFVTALRNSIKTIAEVCGWVVIFRVLITVLDRWIMWYFPKEISILVSGVLELTNGCTALYEISSQSLRFLLCSAMLSFGGLCVGMQTMSVTAGMGIGSYFPGKGLQCCISLVLSFALQAILFDTYLPYYLLFIPIVLISVAVFCCYRKKVVVNSRFL